MKTVQSEVPTAVNPHECIVWDGATNGGGYPQVYHDGKKKLVSHLIWEEETGQSVPKGMYICHDCDTPECITFDHFFLGTPRDNSLDMIAKGRGRGHFLSTDYCKRGHSLLDPQNVITHSDGRRNCRVCQRVHYANYRRRIKENPGYEGRQQRERERRRQRIAAESPEEREKRLAKARVSGSHRWSCIKSNSEVYERELEKSRVRSRAHHARLASEEPEKYEARLARQRYLASERSKRKGARP